MKNMRNKVIVSLAVASIVCSMVACNTYAPTVEDVVVEDEVENTVLEAVEEPIVEDEEPVVEEVIYGLVTDEPEFNRVIYTSDDVINFAQELKSVYPDMSEEEIIGYINAMNSVDYATGTIEELRSTYSIEIEKVYADWDIVPSTVYVPDFVMNPQVKEYAVVIDKCVNDEDNYMQFYYYAKNKDVDYNYDFIYNADSEQIGYTSFVNAFIYGCRTIERKYRNSEYNDLSYEEDATTIMYDCGNVYFSPVYGIYFDE